MGLPDLSFTVTSTITRLLFAVNVAGVARFLGGLCGALRRLASQSEDQSKAEDAVAYRIRKLNRISNCTVRVADAAVGSP